MAEAAGAVAPSPPSEPAVPATHVHPPSLLDEGRTPEPAKDATPAAVDPAKPTEAKKDEPAKPEPAAPAAPAEPPPPIAYEFKFPDSIPAEAIDKPLVEKYSGILNKARVPPEVAQEALDLHLAEVQRLDQSIRENQWNVFNRQVEGWQAQVKADPELGGSRIKQVLRTAASTIEQFGGSPAQQKAIWDAMRTTGAGNHPEVLRLFYRIGDLLAREGSAKPTPPARQLPLTREQKQAARYSGSAARAT